jgi:hypothetical protein
MLQLLCHPKTPVGKVTGVSAIIESSPDGAMWLRYFIDVPEPEITAVGPRSPDRTDELWKTTCFEAFLAIEGEPHYLEFNFAPSSQWAAYRFDDYRLNGTDLVLESAPVIGLDLGSSHFALEADLRLPPEWRGRKLSVGLSVVAEEPSGIKSYWALKHNKSEPDFHDRACFTLQLEAAA